MYSLLLLVVLLLIIFLIYLATNTSKGNPLWPFLVICSFVLCFILCIIAVFKVKHESVSYSYPVKSINDQYINRMDNNSNLFSYEKNSVLYYTSVSDCEIEFTDTIKSPVYMITKYTSKPSWFSKKFGFKVMYDRYAKLQLLYPVNYKKVEKEKTNERKK